MQTRTPSHPHPHPVHSRSVSNWCSSKTLAALVEVNELCIEILCEVAIQATSSPRISPIEQLRSTFATLDAAARRRAAQCPLLLAEVEFRNALWWQYARKPQRLGRISEALPALPRKRAAQLMRAVLILAWHTARFEREAASLVMGMAPEVVDLVATHTLREIDQISHAHACSVRPRWSDRILTWRSLLIAAQDSNTESIRDFQIYALQLAGGEALRHAG